MASTSMTRKLLLRIHGQGDHPGQYRAPPPPPLRPYKATSPDDLSAQSGGKYCNIQAAPRYNTMNRELKIFVCLVAIGVAHARPGFLHGGLSSVAYSAPAVLAGPVAVSSQYHAQDALGQYSYGYSGGPSSKVETKTADGITRGGYSYIDSNVLPAAAPILVNGVPADTLEVAAAKAAHYAAHIEEKARIFG
ncbi:cuticle protein 5-like [Zootermopsis nevadensis]|uniref:cuticle protein 5-like n=1 Tax=Zootermopsis nevadensis TaxID=136037 RepID=UPI000B8E272A|nr:cuticle protein 5-like [Zootermopsis nevadensis]